MSQTIAISIEPIEAFRKLFPIRPDYTHDDRMTYNFRSTRHAEILEKEANKLIEKNELPLDAWVEVWSSNGYVHQISLIIEIKKHFLCSLQSTK